MTALAVLLLLAACTRDEPRPAPSWERLTPRSTAWTIRMPSDWTTSTEVLEPGPRARVGVMTTAVSNVEFHPGRDAPSPNGRGGAGRLGDRAGIVLIQLLWDPNEKDPWKPPRNQLLRMSPSRWHDDAQNQGWRFRERKICMGWRPAMRQCVSVVEWHSSSASEADLSRMSEIASSIELAAT